jgi:hypothetical protein
MRTATRQSDRAICRQRNRRSIASRGISSTEVTVAAMWLPSELLTLCHSIIDPTSRLSAISTYQGGHQHDHDITLQANAPSENCEHPQRHAAFPLLQLPLDILALHLPAHLPYDSLISLRLSSRDLFTAIPRPKMRRPDELTSCEREAILTALEEGKEQSTRRCCVICRSWYPIALFTWVPHQRVAQGTDTRIEGNMMENRVCRWHRGRFGRSVQRAVSRKDEATEQGWTLEEACMHCGGVLAWGRCDCEMPCRTCWKREVWCHTRILEMKTARPDS